MLITSSRFPGAGTCGWRPKTCKPSALAEIDPTLLAKSDPPPRSSGGAFARRQEAFLTTGRFPANPGAATERFHQRNDISPQGSALHASGVDDTAGLVVCPLPIRVPRVGHFKQAEVGHFCRAPRACSVLPC